ncbi:MAG: putative type restriction enzyme MjaXP protein [Verrucomicrobiales bacterium]|nr:putative type restriction enzyme MjaXP protein [Verrucomicrobiales bacterium]
MSKAKSNGSSANVGFEAKLWLAVDKLLSNIVPCCGSGGMFVSSEKFVEEPGGRVGYIAVYGQDKSARWQCRFGLPKEARRVSTRRRASHSDYTKSMNLALRGQCEADSFRADLHPEFKADFIYISSSVSPTGLVKGAESPFRMKSCNERLKAIA